jgi:hypothetical protein
MRPLLALAAAALALVSVLSPLTPVEARGSRSGYHAPRSGAGGSVHVRGYTRRDGTYVRPHTRACRGCAIPRTR